MRQHFSHGRSSRRMRVAMATPGVAGAAVRDGELTVYVAADTDLNSVRRRLRLRGVNPRAVVHADGARALEAA